MLTNAQMTPNRYGRWARARRMVRDIQTVLQAGGTVIVATYLHAQQFGKPSQAAMFKATRTGAYMQRGKHWDCIDGCSIRFYQ
ncbi:MAG: hypothetical protein KGL39_20785 [Patescibacteria group bacterium]|nr:hypothetical protein [Patescibacteria group bacterium]